MGCIDVGLFVGNNNEYSVTQLSCINFFELPDRNGVGCIDVCLQMEQQYQGIKRGFLYFMHYSGGLVILLRVYGMHRHPTQVTDPLRPL